MYRQVYLTCCIFRGHKVAGMPEPWVQRVQVHPMPFVFIIFGCSAGADYGCNSCTRDFKRICYKK